MANGFNHGRHCVGLKVIISFPRSLPLLGGGGGGVWACSTVGKYV